MERKGRRRQKEVNGPWQYMMEKKIDIVSLMETAENYVFPRSAKWKCNLLQSVIF